MSQPNMGMSTDSSTDGGHEELLAEIEDGLGEGLFPLETFGNQEVYDLEMDRIFGREWILVGHESEIPEEGDYARRSIADNPFIFVRDRNGDVQVLFDSCRHRGTKLCQAEQGNTSHFRCPYHGWTYKNTGDLVGVPHKADAFPELDREDYSLHSAPRIDTYGGLVFASLSESGPSLDEHLGEFTWYLDVHFNLPENGLEVLGEPNRWVIDMNWKTGMDNFAGDSYHTGFAHQSIKEMDLAGEDTVGTQKSETTKYKHILCDRHTTSTRLVEGGDVFMTYPDEVVERFDPEKVTDEQYRLAKEAISFTGSLYPNVAFLNFGDTTDAPGKDPTGFFCIRKWQPLGPNKTEMWSWVFAPKGVSQAVKDRIYDVYISHFGPAGNFEQDDIAIWKSISDVADTTFAKRNEVNVTSKMGMEHMGEAPLDEDWRGPGEAYSTNLEELGIQQFHESWFEQLSSPVDDKQARLEQRADGCGGCDHGD